MQHARIQGLALREIARQLGVSRNTVRKYARALTQPTNRPETTAQTLVPNYRQTLGLTFLLPICQEIEAAWRDAAAAGREAATTEGLVEAARIFVLTTSLDNDTIFGSV